jgi:hypothetical protein
MSDRVRHVIAAAICCWGIVFSGVAHAGAVHNVSATSGKAEGEEFVAVNPTNRQNIIVGSNQWYPPTPQNIGNFGIGPGGATACAVWSSHDGGRTWKGGRLEETGIGANQGSSPPTPVTVPDEFGDPGNVISADQNIVFDRRGNAWYQCINFGARTGEPAVFVYKTTDGGHTWRKPVKAFSESQTGIQIDRSYLAIDNSGRKSDGNLYLTFETMFYQANQPEVYVRKSTDAGRTWGPVVRVDDSASEAQWDPRQYPVVGPHGSLYVLYDAAQFVSPAPFDPETTPLKLMVARSDDQGRTFSHHVVEPNVNRITSHDEAFIYFTETIPAIAADAAHPGRVAVAWPDDRSGEARILLRYSTTCGRKWSRAIDVADDPKGQGNEHDHVALTYLPDGRLVVVWRDRRDSGGAFGTPLQVYARAFNVNRYGRLTKGRTITVTTKPQADGENTHGNMPTEYLGATSDRRWLSVSWDELRGSYLDNVYRRIPLSAFGPNNP